MRSPIVLRRTHDRILQDVLAAAEAERRQTEDELARLKDQTADHLRRMREELEDRVREVREGILEVIRTAPTTMRTQYLKTRLLEQVMRRFPLRGDHVHTDTATTSTATLGDGGR